MEPLSSFIAVFSDFSSKLYSSKETALKQPDIYCVAQQIILGSFSTWKEDRKKFGLQIFGSNGQSIDLSLNGWVIKTETIESFYYTNFQLKFQMIDPTGEIRDTLIYSKALTISIAVDLCEYLQSYKLSSSWDYHDLLLENQRLKKRISYLESLSPQN